VVNRHSGCSSFRNISSRRWKTKHRTSVPTASNDSRRIIEEIIDKTENKKNIKVLNTSTNSKL
jgi:hypothetical protein